MTTKETIKEFFNRHSLVTGNARLIQIELEDKFDKKVSLPTVKKSLNELLEEGFLTKYIGRRLVGRVDHVLWGRADRREIKDRLNR